MLPNLKQIVFAAASLLALVGCASNPPQPQVNVQVDSAKMPPPAAWAMQPPRSMRQFNKTFSTFGTQ